MGSVSGKIEEWKVAVLGLASLPEQQASAKRSFARGSNLLRSRLPGFSTSS